VIATVLEDAGYRVHRDTRRATVMIKDEQMEAWRVEKFGADSDNPIIAGDDADPDGDRQPNAAEFLADTEPRDATSFFGANVTPASNGFALIRFKVGAKRGYSVLFKDSLTDPDWQKLIDIPADSAAREVAVADPALGVRAQRFYRIFTPQPP
jgi:hypothetical protein